VSEELNEPAFDASPGADTQFPVPQLHGRYVFLRQVHAEDYRLLRAVELTGEPAVRWRFRGSSPSPETWAHTLWNGILAQFIVVRVGDEPAPLGMVFAYRPSFQDGHVWLAAHTFGPQRPSPLMMFGTALFIEHVFTCWNFHKLYLEVAAYNLPQFESGTGRLFEVEGRLRDHFWYGGRRWDQVFLAMYRETWERESVRVLAAQRPPAQVTASVRLPPRQDT
jgi:hypothetical protein